MPARLALVVVAARAPDDRVRFRQTAFRETRRLLDERARVGSESERDGHREVDVGHRRIDVFDVGSDVVPFGGRATR